MKKRIYSALRAFFNPTLIDDLEKDLAYNVTIRVLYHRGIHRALQCNNVVATHRELSTALGKELLS